MKKQKLIVAPLLAAVLLFTLCGCTDYPQVTVSTSVWRYDNILIRIESGYVLNYGHPYETVKTDDGADVIIHFVSEEGKP